MSLRNSNGLVAVNDEVVGTVLEIGPIPDVPESENFHMPGSFIPPEDTAVPAHVCEGRYEYQI